MPNIRNCTGHSLWRCVYVQGKRRRKKCKRRENKRKRDTEPYWVMHCINLFVNYLSAICLKFYIIKYYLYIIHKLHRIFYACAIYILQSSLLAIILWILWNAMPMMCSVHLVKMCDFACWKHLRLRFFLSFYEHIEHMQRNWEMCHVCPYVCGYRSNQIHCFYNFF